MEKLCIIDHTTHSVYIENVSDEKLAEYNGEEEAYIADNYSFEGDYSWDWIVDVNVINDEFEVVDITSTIDELTIYKD